MGRVNLLSILLPVILANFYPFAQHGIGFCDLSLPRRALHPLAELAVANDIYAMVNCVKSTGDSRRRGGSFSAPVATASRSNFSACS